MEATTRQMLERLADRIEATLAGHKISVRITGGQISPRWIQFQTLPALGTRITRLEAMVDVLAAAVDAEACHVTTQRGLVLIEIPRPDAPRDEQPSRPERELAKPLAPAASAELPSAAQLAGQVSRARSASEPTKEPTLASIPLPEVPTSLPFSCPPIRARRRERIDL
jgi:DNA segregation ATPase FtsK/SpoIIIE-like protein